MSQGHLIADVSKYILIYFEKCKIMQNIFNNNDYIVVASVHFKQKPIQVGWKSDIPAVELGINNLGPFY